MSAHRHGTPECREVFARLSEYLDQELDADLCEVLEGHLDDCPPCQVFIESLRRTVGLIRDADPTPLPDTLRAEILEAYRALRERRSSETPGD